MSGTWATDWVTGDVVTAGEFRKSMGCVADSTLGASAASFDFTGLPTTYAHMLVFLYARGDNATAAVNVLMRFNNDSAANYDYQQTVGSAAASTVSETFAATSVFIGNHPANTAGANLFGQSDVVISHYGGSANNKASRALWAQKTGTATTNLQAGEVAGFWRSNAAINRITILPVAGNFVAGSRCSIYVMGS